MLLKQALFLGQVKTGQEAAMRAYVESDLAPLWRQFAGARRVEVLYGVQQDPKGPEIPLVLSVLYENQAKIEQAMASPARTESRDLLPAFYEQFWDEVRLVHTTFEVANDRQSEIAPK